MSPFRSIELMAPAGSQAALTAAIGAGADSVYFGVGVLNMRARSSGFSSEDLPFLAARCCEAGIKSYLALNTIIYDEELDEMHALCARAKAVGVSAIIASDIATMEAARACGLTVHISVQANITNFQALKFYAGYADTVVLARELSLEQISNLWKQIEKHDLRGPSGERIRLEIFAHGALCVAVSGVCSMSLAQYNQSANRGACFQTCRRAYRVTDEETGAELVIDNNYVMSPKDLCTIDCLDRISTTGVSVLKIEGRARSADYVSIVTGVYREALDALADGSYHTADCEEWKARLARGFNRGFWHGGYYCGAKLGEWAASVHSQATETRDQIGILSNFFGQLRVAEFKLIKHDLKKGDTMGVEGPTTGAMRLEIDELRVDGKPTDTAHPGELVTLALPAKARRQDKVFLYTISQERG